MTCRTPSLPFLPGSFHSNPNLYKTNFGRRPVFDHSGDVRILAEKITPYLSGKIHERYPSIYTRDVAELPGWLAFNKQVLSFDAYFQETLHESSSPTILRKCKLYFYLEDGTIKINEPRTKNSGVLQGNVLNRCRVNLPPPKDDLFYDITDLNVGKEVEIFGRYYKLVNCDKFTRIFLNRLGIAVPDPLPFPEDRYMIEREKEVMKFAKKPKIKRDKQVHQNDRKVLRFYAYWDDRESEGGYVHDLIIQYYLVDDTIEIVETMDNKKSLLIKRGKLLKHLSHLPEPGFFEDQTLLNVLANGRFKLDLLNPGRTNLEHYLTTDLVIGAAINIYGRKVILTDCDLFTKNYYNTLHGIDNFTIVERPQEPSPPISVPLHKRKLPPWNGYGSFDDSAQNCITVEPKAQLRDVKQFLELDRNGFESHILRFKAVNRSKPSAGPCGRQFVICYYLCDDTLSIHEVHGKKAGSTFLVRKKIKLPGQEIYVSEEHEYYGVQHLYVGATLNLNSFIFVLIDADEYALRYMELNCEKFPKSNIKYIMDKLRKKIKPIYNDFCAELDLKEKTYLTFDDLRDKIMKLMGDNWTEQEMLTLARYYSATCKEQRHNREFIRSLVLIDLRRNIWQQMERFKECFNHYDVYKTGFLPRNEVYNLIRGCRLPLNPLLINTMLDTLNKNDKCEIEGKELFDFIDESVGRRHDVPPVSQMHTLTWSTEPEIAAGKLIDWCKLAKDINLESSQEEICSQR